MTGLLLAGSARAATLRYEAPERCPSSTRFAEEVTARLGFSPWNGSGTRLRVRITRGQDGFVGVLAPGKARGRRFVADSCRKVTDLLVTATAIALDRSDPAPAARKPPRTAARTPARSRPSAVEPAPTAGAPTPAEVMATWSFAERNNRFQAGLVFVSTTGAGVTGNVPIARGHVQATYARLSSDGGGTNSQLHAYYLWPVFYINEGSSFEVPVHAGGGLGYQSWAYTASGEDHDETAIMPTVVIGTGLQFRRFPVEFLSQMTLSAVETPLGQHMLGFNFAIRYVFRGE